MKIEHEKTKEILKWFEEISKIPRCSKHEEKIVNFLANWASEHGFAWKKDKAGNIVIKVPGKNGLENRPPVVIQGHVDMVCEKTPESTHDFSKDPIKILYKDGYVTADGTTLGADNGIAIAMAMTLALDDSVAHPPLELLFTVDEETGLTGANMLEPSFIEGKILLNVDSEDEGVFTVGCAGGRDTKIELNLDFSEIPEGFKAYQVKAGGMRGGHSGVDIHEQRANAIKVLARTLKNLADSFDFRIFDFSGGTAHNAIPRDAVATIFLSPEEFEKAKESVKRFEEIVKKEVLGIEPNLYLSIEEVKDWKARKCATKDATEKIINVLLALPHGVYLMSTTIKGLVETSSNLATVKVEDDMLKIVTSQRSSIMSRLDEITNQIESIAKLAGAKVVSGNGYPAWEPNWNSKLLELCKQVYKEKFKKEPVIEVIHAGLECGIIGSKFPGMDMISFGPTIKNPHSPDEVLEIESIGKVWDFLVELLKKL